MPLALLALLAGLGCAGHAEQGMTAASIRQRWLSFIEEGKSTRQEVSNQLGPPTATYENGRISAYRLMLSDTSDEPPLEDHGPGWRAGYSYQSEADVRYAQEKLEARAVLFTVHPGDEVARRRRLLVRDAEYSLVLVFDDRGVLGHHSILRVRP